MERYFCKIEMKKVKMNGNLSGMPAFLSQKEKGGFVSEKRSAINTYVCHKCGRIEMIAEDSSIFD